MAYTTIDDPSAYFKVQLYSGNGTAIASGGNVITFNDTDTDMQPDFVWYKERSSTSGHHLHDAVRGVTKKLSSDSNAIDNTNSETLTSFNSDGFTVGDAGGSNQSGQTYVAWCWKAGTTSSITTNGSTNVTPSGYSFNQTSKFSVLKYSGNGNTDNQVAHGIGSKPDFMMVKNMTGSINSWAVFHKSLGNEKYLELDVDNAVADNANRWQDTDPDTVNFTTGSSDTVNNSSYDYMCYAWAEVQGYSKFGSYVGNANADGPFVYTGFRPAWIMIKNTEDGAPFMIMDNKRSGYNPTNNRLYANTTATEEGAVDRFDILSNGFKIKTSDNDTNKSGDLFIYAAFAKAPFVNSNGVPCNAR
jgi:hypothetical protein